MRRISRRDFIKRSGGLGICALGGGALLSCAREGPILPVTEQVVEGIQLTQGEDYLQLEDGRVQCLACISHLPNRIESKVYPVMGRERPIRRTQGESLGRAGATPAGFGGEVGFPLGPGRTSPFPKARAYAATWQSLGGGKAKGRLSPAGSRGWGQRGSRSSTKT